MIEVDRREHHGGAELASELRDCGMEVKVKELEFGDVRFVGNGYGGPWWIGMELKKVTDLVGSIHVSRLSDKQVPGMHTLYNRCYIVVQGVTRRNWSTGLLETSRWDPATSKRGWVPVRLGPVTVPWSALDSMIASLRNQGGCFVERTRDLSGTAEFITSEYTWWQKKWGEHSTFKGFLTGAPSPLVLHRPQFARRIAKELPNIGWEKSADVVRKFKTVENMVAATVEMWQEIPGIGLTIATRAWNAWRGK